MASKEKALSCAQSSANREGIAYYIRQSRNGQWLYGAWSRLNTLTDGIVEKINPTIPKHYDSGVLSAVTQNLGLEYPRDKDKALARMADMSKDEIWDRYCIWHGLINWSGTLHMVHDSIYK